MKVMMKQKGMSGEISEIVWAGGAVPTDEVGVMLSVAQILSHAKENDPWSPTILSVTIEL